MYDMVYHQSMEQTSNTGGTMNPEKLARIIRWHEQVIIDNPGDGAERRIRLDSRKALRRIGKTPA